MKKSFFITIAAVAIFLIVFGAIEMSHADAHAIYQAHEGLTWGDAVDMANAFELGGKQMIMAGVFAFVVPFSVYKIVAWGRQTAA